VFLDDDALAENRPYSPTRTAATVSVTPPHGERHDHGGCVRRVVFRG
jgi:hypothetical protein